MCVGVVIGLIVLVGLKFVFFKGGFFVRFEYGGSVMVFDVFNVGND